MACRDARTLRLYDRTPRQLAAAAVLALVTGCVMGPGTPAPEPPSPVTVTLWEWGEYEPAPVRAQAPAAGTTTGEVHVLDPMAVPRLLQRTDEIRASVGVRFGIRFIVNGPSFGTVVPVRIRVLHPPMHRPSRRITEQEEWAMEANARLPRFTGWRFEELWELVPGRWAIQVLDGDVVAAEKAFAILP